jgi:hypothetical protein
VTSFTFAFFFILLKINETVHYRRIKKGESHAKKIVHLTGHTRTPHPSFVARLESTHFFFPFLATMCVFLLPIVLGLGVSVTESAAWPSNSAGIAFELKGGIAFELKPHHCGFAQTHLRPALSRFVKRPRVATRTQGKKEGRNNGRTTGYL